MSYLQDIAAAVATALESAGLTFGEEDAPLEVERSWIGQTAVADLDDVPLVTVAPGRDIGRVRSRSGTTSREYVIDVALRARILDLTNESLDTLDDLLGELAAYFLTHDLTGRGEAQVGDEIIPCDRQEARETLTYIGVVRLTFGGLR